MRGPPLARGSRRGLGKSVGEKELSEDEHRPEEFRPPLGGRSRLRGAALRQFLLVLLGSAASLAGAIVAYRGVSPSNTTHGATAYFIAVSAGATVAAIALTGLAMSRKASLQRAELARLRGRAHQLECVIAARDAGRGEPRPPVPLPPEAPLAAEAPLPAQPPPNRQWLLGIVGSVAVALITSGFAVITAVASKSDPPPDCVAYAKEIADLDAHYSPAQLHNAFGELRFERYETACGSASKIVALLHRTGSTPSQSSSPSP
jgi:hypothetical protein